jgi:hypothetical protein
MWRSTSSVSSRSSLPPDIVNSEQLSFESNDSFNFDKWNIPKLSNKEIYTTSWLKSAWKSEYSVKTVEQTFAISGNNSTFQLFNKIFVNDSKNKEYKFLHVGSVQVAVKPLTRLGINASDFDDSLPPPHQCNAIHAVSKDFFSLIDWPALQKDYSSKKNKDLRHVYLARFSEKERDFIKVQWTRKMIKYQKHILFFDFLQKYFPLDNVLNVVKKNFVKEDKTVVQSSHPPLENILIECNGVTVKGSPFKSANDVPRKSRKIIEQNNFVNTPLPPWYKSLFFTF